MLRKIVEHPTSDFPPDWKPDLLPGLVSALDEAEDRPLVHALPALLALAADLVVQPVLDAGRVAKIKVQPVDVQLFNVEDGV